MQQDKFAGLSLSSGFLAVGEMLLGLNTVDHELLSQADTFQVIYTGSEGNVAMGLANLGGNCRYFSVFPDNGIGQGALKMLRSNRVDTAPVILTKAGEVPCNRLGAFFIESGYGIRSSKAIYDRKHSAFADYDYSKVDAEQLLEGIRWLHISGINPPLSPGCAELTVRLLKAAREKHIVVSFDGNYRSALWTWEEARDFLTGCLPYVDVLFGIEPYHLWKDEQDQTAGDVKDGLSMEPSPEQQKAVFDAFAARYPNLRYMVRHVRTMHSGTENTLKAYLWHDGDMVESRPVTFTMLNRAGSGDAFTAGILYGILNGYELQKTADFGVAMGSIKATMPGEASFLTDPGPVWDVLSQRYEIRR